MYERTHGELQGQGPDDSRDGARLMRDSHCMKVSA